VLRLCPFIAVSFTQLVCAYISQLHLYRSSTPPDLLRSVTDARSPESIQLAGTAPGWATSAAVIVDDSSNPPYLSPLWRRHFEKPLNHNISSAIRPI